MGSVMDIPMRAWHSDPLAMSARDLCVLYRETECHVFGPAITWNDHSHGAMMTEANNGPHLDGFDRFYYGF